MDYRSLDLDNEEGVYEASEDSFLAAELISDYIKGIRKKNIKVLDMGTASGILGLVAASSKKVGSVTFADINPKAVALSEKNFQKNKEKIEASPRFVLTDLFSNIGREERFDIIIFNAPYLRNEKENEDKEHNPWSGGKEGVELSIRFLQEAVDHLEDKGRIVLVGSSLSKKEKIKQEVERLHLKAFEERKVHYFFEDIIVWMIGR